MDLKILPQSTVAEISEQFNQFLPFLKLIFFREAHGKAEASGKKGMIKNSVLISMISENNKYGEFEFSQIMTVFEFEKHMKIQFGLNAQVFRKSGNVWLETTVTDNLTLQSQNALGMEKSVAAEQPDPSDIDYD